MVVPSLPVIRPERADVVAIQESAAKPSEKPVVCRRHLTCPIARKCQAYRQVLEEIEPVAKRFPTEGIDPPKLARVHSVQDLGIFETLFQRPPSTGAVKSELKTAGLERERDKRTYGQNAYGVKGNQEFKGLRIRAKC
jgi:hypothetical protein